jgi:hypothetical protein
VDAGEVITVRSRLAPGELLLAVVIASASDEVRVAVIDIYPGQLSDDELMLAPGDSPLGYEALVQLWNIGYAPRGAVAERLGRLRPDVHDELERAAPDGTSAAGVAADDARWDRQQCKREQAARFMTLQPVSFAALFAAAERTRAVMEPQLRERGWSKDALVRLRSGVVDPREVTVVMAADLMDAAGWSTADPAAHTVVRESFRDAVKASQVVVGGARRRPVLHFFKQPGIGNPPTDPDVFVEAVFRELESRRASAD